MNKLFFEIPIQPPAAGASRLYSSDKKTLDAQTGPTLQTPADGTEVHGVPHTS